MQLNHKSWVPEELKETHEFLMHQRHTLFAHSGTDSLESCRLVMLLDSSPKERAPPISYYEIIQPSGLPPSEVLKIDKLLEYIESKVSAKLDMLIEKIHRESLDSLTDAQLSSYRKSVAKTLLLNLPDKPRTRP